MIIEQLDEWQKRCAEVRDSESKRSRFSSFAGTAMPALIAEVRRLQAWRDKAESALHESRAACRHINGHGKAAPCTYCTEVSDLLARSPGRK